MSLNSGSLSKDLIYERFSLAVHEDGYYVVYVFDDQEFTAEDLKLLVNAQEEHFSSKKLPVLSICAENAITNTDLLRVLSKNKNNPFSKADAFVIESMAQKILANFYMRIFKPERPTKFFNNKHDAVVWLKQYL
jgi:hypothetical protein